MAGMLKNLRHELFLKEYVVNGMNGRQAYITVYGACKSADQQAYKVLNKPKVRKRFNQMLKKIVKRADITEERILGKYEEAFELTQEQGKPSDMISAASAQAKLVGMLRDKIEAGGVGDFDRMENMSDVLEALSQRVGPEAALQISAALGIVQAEAQPAEDQSLLAETQPASDAVN